MSLSEIRERHAQAIRHSNPFAYHPGDATYLLTLLDEAKAALEEQAGECQVANDYGEDCQCHFDDGGTGERCWTFPCLALQVLQKMGE